LRLAKRVWALARQLAPGCGWAVAELGHRRHGWLGLWSRLGRLASVWPLTFGPIVDELGRVAMRFESSVTSLSWIPQGAVEGFNRLSFGLGVAHFDSPPPEVLSDLDDYKQTTASGSPTASKPGSRSRTGASLTPARAAAAASTSPKWAMGRPASRSPRSPCPIYGPPPRLAPPGRALSRPRAVRPVFPHPAGSATNHMSRSGDP
jgi:hypothetical protein